MNSKSIDDKLSNSLRSNKSNRNLIVSSNLASENKAIPLNSSKASIKPLLSVSQITKADSLALKICWNSIRSIEKLSQRALKVAW